MGQKAKDTFITPELTVDELSKALYKVTQSLQRSNTMLMEAKQQQQDFFSNISHDLRSPIAAIKSSVEYLQTYNDLDHDECMQIYSIMMKKITYMEHMISDIFLLSTLETNQRKLQLEELPIGMFLEEFYYSCKQDPHYKECELHLLLPDNLSFLVHIDTTLLTRVLNNLFTNAMKYSKGAPYILLSAVQYDASKVVIAVEDHGIGIAPEHLKHIFNESYMVSAARSPTAASGCGLGLAIAKSIIELHGGTIWCKSNVSKGSKFYFTLPITYKKE